MIPKSVSSATFVGRIEPAPARIRGVVADAVVFDTLNAIYVWESERVPHYFVPLVDIDVGAFVDENRALRLKRGLARRHGIRVGDVYRPRAAHLYTEESVEEVRGMVRFEWSSLDAWFEEDVQIYVHPKSPYVRVDAVRSSRTVRVDVGGTTIAESRRPVTLFETGLPVQYYLDKVDINVPLSLSARQDRCPYKGQTSAFWSARVGPTFYQDLAWSYDFPSAAITAVAGLVAFDRSKVGIVVDGEPEATV